ncbi:MAG: GDP-L-fucose synthase [Sinimarinibacterium flocculans]|uniref:GDP-L-fucose synthase n=1 Tax=Sinimarinibacterium flocculans TaxID=985250 RepID=A0A318E919_9GAMM|nr:GDP-L-fucose synthase [Sinimarinibacterium flocculans]PXV67788.1 GDP-L-fucose synthase [Sinimarinibacterium flocculans]
MSPQSKIYVAGHGGLAGGAIVRALRKAGFENLLLRTHRDLDLSCQADVEDFFSVERPDYVFLAAARVGGIHANSAYPAEFIRDNLAIQTNVIHSAWRHGAKKLLFLGSSCIYPKLAPQPMPEECLLTGALEPTNEWYAVAKIAGIKMCQAYRRQYGFDAISLMPTNLYGPGDNFDLQNAHVLPALIRRFHAAKVDGASEVVMWGTGTPRREFLHVDDLGDAAVFLMRHYSGDDIVNVGVGEDVTIRDLAEIIRSVVGYAGHITQDLTKPDGTPRKLMDVTRLLAMGWRAQIGLREGIAQTYAWFLDNEGRIRGA